MVLSPCNVYILTKLISREKPGAIIINPKISSMYPKKMLRKCPLPKRTKVNSPYAYSLLNPIEYPNRLQIAKLARPIIIIPFVCDKINLFYIVGKNR